MKQRSFYMLLFVPFIILYFSSFSNSQSPKVCFTNLNNISFVNKINESIDVHIKGKCLCNGNEIIPIPALSNINKRITWLSECYYTEATIEAYGRSTNEFYGRVDIHDRRHQNIQQINFRRAGHPTIE